MSDLVIENILRGRCASLLRARIKECHDMALVEGDYLNKQRSEVVRKCYTGF